MSCKPALSIYLYILQNRLDRKPKPIKFPNTCFGGQLDSHTHSTLARRARAVLARASDRSYELPDGLSAWQRESPVAWPVADLPPPRGVPLSDLAPPDHSNRCHTRHLHPSHHLHPQRPTRPEHASMLSQPARPPSHSRTCASFALFFFFFLFFIFFSFFRRFSPVDAWRHQSVY